MVFVICPICRCECYDYLFDIAVQMKQCGMDPSALPMEEKGIIWHSLTAASLRDLYCRKVSGVQSAEQIVIISPSSRSAPDLSNGGGEGRFDVEGDPRPVIVKQSGAARERAAVRSRSWVSNAFLISTLSAVKSGRTLHMSSLCVSLDLQLCLLINKMDPQVEFEWFVTQMNLNVFYRVAAHIWGEPELGLVFNAFICLSAAQLWSVVGACVEKIKDLLRVQTAAPAPKRLHLSAGSFRTKAFPLSKGFYSFPVGFLISFLPAPTAAYIPVPPPVSTHERVLSNTLRAHLKEKSFFRAAPPLPEIFLVMINEVFLLTRSLK